MDTAIAVIIIVLAGVYVFRKVRNQFREKGGCGCSGECTSDPRPGTCCCGDKNACSQTDKKQ